jgi:hypothetical protein
MEKIYQIYCQTRHHWYADFSVKCQTNVSFKATVLMLTLKKSFPFGQSLPTIPKMSFTIENKALISNNKLINNRCCER